MIQIPFEYLKKSGEQGILTADAIILYLIYNKENKLYQEFIELPTINTFDVSYFFKSYEQFGFLKITGNNLPEDIEFRKLFLDLLPTSERLDVDWTKEWLDLWPSGVKSGSRYVKASEKDITELLKKFIKKYKFSKEVIIEATKKYLEEKKKVNWSYITCSDYFISKNNVSLLASYCANLGVKEPSVSSINKMI